MPRAARKRSEGDVYHVTMRGEGRRIIFEDDDDRETFLRMLSSSLDKNGGEVFAWCLMSNHVHLLLHVPADRLPRFMQSLASGYAVYYNNRHDHVGHVFAGRYGSRPVNGDEYLLTVLRYIHANPVKDKVSPTCDYRWSSYNDYVSGGGIASTALVLGVVGGVDNFASLHADLADSECQQLLECAVRGRGRRLLRDDEALEIALDACGVPSLEEIARLPKAERNAEIAVMRRLGLTTRQIERFTGIGRGIVDRVKWR